MSVAKASKLVAIVWASKAGTPGCFFVENGWSMLRLMIKWQMKDALHILIIGNHSLHRFNLESTESDRRVGRRHSLQSVLFMEPLNGFHYSREIPSSGQATSGRLGRCGQVRCDACSCQRLWAAEISCCGGVWGAHGEMGKISLNMMDFAHKNAGANIIYITIEQWNSMITMGDKEDSEWIRQKEKKNMVMQASTELKWINTYGEPCWCEHKVTRVLTPTRIYDWMIRWLAGT